MLSSVDVDNHAQIHTPTFVCTFATHPIKSSKLSKTRALLNICLVGCHAQPSLTPSHTHPLSHAHIPPLLIYQYDICANNIHTYLHTCIHKYMIMFYKPTYLETCMLSFDAHIPTYTTTTKSCIHTHTHTHTHIYTAGLASLAGGVSSTTMTRLVLSNGGSAIISVQTIGRE